jgi:hypothetical protein
MGRTRLKPTAATSARSSAITRGTACSRKASQCASASRTRFTYHVLRDLVQRTTGRSRRATLLFEPQKPGESRQARMHVISAAITIQYKSIQSLLAPHAAAAPCRLGAGLAHAGAHSARSALVNQQPTQPCHDFGRGNCPRGDACRYLHPPSRSQLQPQPHQRRQQWLRLRLCRQLQSPSRQQTHSRSLLRFPRSRITDHESR